jgi:hypothetical protein
VYQSWPIVREFNLPQQANVVVVGTGQGLMIQLIADVYPDYREIVGFEPREWAAAQAVARLALYRDTSVLQWGLGVGDDLQETGEFFAGEEELSFGLIRDADWSLNFIEANSIDLMVIDMGGHEVLLLPYLVEKGWLDKVDRLAVRTQSGQDILELVSKTHRLVDCPAPDWLYWVK